MNGKRINSATWFRLCQNLISYWILDILCGIYFSILSMIVHTIVRISWNHIRRKKNQSTCKRLSMPAACCIPYARKRIRYDVCMLRFFFFLFMDDQIRMTFLGKQVGSSLRRNIHYLFLFAHRSTIFSPPQSTQYLPTTYLPILCRINVMLSLLYVSMLRCVYRLHVYLYMYTTHSLSIG